MNKDRIIEEQNKSLAEAWTKIEYLEELVNDLRCGIQATKDMLDDDTFTAGERIGR